MQLLVQVISYNLLYELNIQFPGLWFDMGWTHFFLELALYSFPSLVFSKQGPWLNIGSDLMSPLPWGKWDYTLAKGFSWVVLAISFSGLCLKDRDVLIGCLGLVISLQKSEKETPMILSWGKEKRTPVRNLFPFLPPVLKKPGQLLSKDRCLAPTASPGEVSPLPHFLHPSHRPPPPTLFFFFLRDFFCSVISPKVRR